MIFMVKICVAANSGGHMSEILQYRSVYERFDHFFVTDSDRSTTKVSASGRVYFVDKFILGECVERVDPITPVKNLLQSLRILVKERPDIVVTTGAGTAFGTCLLCRLFGARLVFIETIARVHSPSRFGRIIHHLANLTLVPWEGMQRHYRGAVFVGPNIDAKKANSGPVGWRIFVTVGTKMQFDRLLREMDILLGEGRIKAKVKAQIGVSGYRPSHYEYFDFSDRESICDLMEEADIVVAHGGVGSVTDALRLGNRVVVVPRLKAFGEGYDDHQLEFVREMEKRGLILPVYDIGGLEDAIRGASDFSPRLHSPRNHGVHVLESFVAGVIRHGCD